MARYEITSPDGGRYEVTAPDDATEDQLKAYVEQQLKTTAPPAAQNAQQAPSAAPQAPNAPVWSDVPMEALKNVPASAGRFLGGIYDALTSPAETARALVDLGTGAARAGMRAVAPDFTARRDAAMIEDNPESAAQSARADALASGAWEALKNRYGGSEEIRRTLATDPVGVASDLSLLLGAGAATAPGRAGAMLQRGANVTNPMNAVAKPAAWLGEKAAGGVANTLGMTTGIGNEAIREAYRAGVAGGKVGEDFRSSMRGADKADTIVDAAKANIGDMKAAASAQYLDDQRTWAQAGQQVDFAPVDRAMKKVADTYKHKGHWTVGPDVQRVVGDVAKVVEEWKLDPAVHNVMGLDGLKRRIGQIGFDKISEPNAGRAVKTMYNAVKNEIVNAAPEYGKAMESASANIRRIKDIQRELSLGDKASVDTALRKLTSMTRNNVNTNFGRRLELGRQLDAGGAENIIPRIAGLSANTWTPRGIQALASTGAIGASFANPSFLAALPFQSPRLMAEAAHAAGRASGPAGNALGPVAGAVRQNAPMLEHLGDLYDLRQRRR